LGRKLRGRAIFLTLRNITTGSRTKRRVGIKGGEKKSTTNFLHLRRKNFEKGTIGARVKKATEKKKKGLKKTEGKEGCPNNIEGEKPKNGGRRALNFWTSGETLGTANKNPVGKREIMRKNCCHQQKAGAPTSLDFKNTDQKRSGETGWGRGKGIVAGK